MYQLLDLRNCQDEIRVSPEDPCAILDTEHATIAAITGNGRLICCNRAFLLKYNVDHKGGCYLTIREALPSLWELFKRPPPRDGEKTVRIINLRLDSSAKPLTVQYLSFNSRRTSPSAQTEKLASNLLMVNDGSLDRFKDCPCVSFIYCRGPEMTGPRKRR